MKLTKYLYMSLVVFSLVGCSLFGGDEDVVQVAAVPTINNQFNVTKVWTNSTSGSNHIYTSLSPVNYDNIIYVASRSGEVKALDNANGNTLWSTDLSNSTLFTSNSALFSGGVSVDASHVYLGSERAVVYAIDRQTGKLSWEKPVKGEVLAKPVLDDSKVVIHTANGYLQTLDSNTGKELWDLTLEVPNLSLRGNSVPTIAHGAIIVGDDSGRVNAFYLNDGQLIWQQRISQPSGSTEIAKLNDVDTTPIVEGAHVYAVGYNGNLVELDLSNGQIIWRKDVGTTHSLIANSKNLFIVDQNDNIQAIAKNGGATIWKQSELLNRQLTDPVIDGNYIVVGDFEGYLYWINIENGEIATKIEVNSSGLMAKPLVIDNKIIVQAKNGNIYAFTKN